MELVELSIVGVKRGLARKDFSCWEYVDALLKERLQQHMLNCFITDDEERLRAAASAFDTNPWTGALAGVPIGFKDNIDVHGIPTTAGSAALRNNVPRESAPLAQSIFDAGALFGGKLTLHELALGITNNNSVFGACRNPYNLGMIPGGSSGGCSAAIAARLLPGAFGTDTGGSVRLPAALCGVTGFRPTTGRYPSAGIFPISHTKDTAGPIARSVEDLALLDDVAVGSVFGNALPVLRPNDLRLGILRHPGFDRLDDSVAAVSTNALKKLESAGIVLIDVAVHDLEQLNVAAGFPVALYEFLTDVPSYLHAAGSSLTLNVVARGIGSPDVAAIVKGAIDNPVSKSAYQGALSCRKALQSAYERCFTTHQLDALLFPTSPLTARPIGSDETIDFNGLRLPTFSTYVRNTDPASNAGIPGVTVPAGLTASGLPVGIELDGAAGSDRHLLAVAAVVERILGPLPRPARTTSVSFTTKIATE